MEVEFRTEDYGPEIARLLALAGDGRRPMPLVKVENAPIEACKEINRLKSLQNSVLSGLYFYFACWDAAHAAADSVENPNGYFWHAIVHRQEPDADNAAYWFRQTGKHPIFPRLALAANDAGYRTADEWNPFAFIEFCESARRRPASPDEHLAMRVQLLEWQLLFDHCARSANC